MKKASMVFGRVFLVAVTLALLTDAGMALARSEHQYISAGELAGRLRDRVPTLVIDVRVKEEFDKSHIVGAIPAHSYPVLTEVQRAQLDALLPRLAADESDIVLVCPRGGGSANRTHAHLTSRGIPAKRLFILEKGQEGWPYSELTEGQ